MHVFSLTGDRTLSLKLQSTTVDRVTLPTFTAVGSGFGSSTTVTGHTNWRVVATLGGTTGTATFAAFCAIQ